MNPITAYFLGIATVAVVLGIFYAGMRLGAALERKRPNG